jgi:hypothetical protein
MAALAKIRADAANPDVTAVKDAKERLERDEKLRLEAEKNEAAADYKRIVGNGTNGGTPPVKPNLSKFAAPVPGKPGFVYNPFTRKEVDVRGIPSGTRVRDPHDSNPAHIFKVP